MLLEKYRPEKIDAMINREIAREVKDMIEKKKKFIISGPIGCGKSVALDIISRDLRYEIIYVTEETLSQSADFIKQRSLFYQGKIVLVDLDLVKSVGKIIELVDNSVFPVVFMANNIYQKKFYELRKAFPLVRFKKISQYVMYNLLKDVCQTEHIKYDETSLKKMISLCGSDVRATLISLDGLKDDGITEQSVQCLAECRDFDVFEILAFVFGNDFNRAREIINKTDDDIFPWIEANLSDQKSLAAYEHIAKADLFNARTRRRQSWGLLKYYYDHIAAISTLNINKKMFKPPYHRKND